MALMSTVRPKGCPSDSPRQRELVPLAARQVQLMNRIRSKDYQQHNIRMRWNWLSPARRLELFYRYMDRLERLFDSLNLTAMCTHCGAVMPATEYSYRDECPECGWQEIATPYGC